MKTATSFCIYCRPEVAKQLGLLDAHVFFDEQFEADVLGRALVVGITKDIVGTGFARSGELEDERGRVTDEIVFKLMERLG